MRRLLRPPTRAYRGLLGSALRTFPASSAVGLYGLNNGDGHAALCPSCYPPPTLHVGKAAWEIRTAIECFGCADGHGNEVRKPPLADLHAAKAEVLPAEGHAPAVNAGLRCPLWLSVSPIGARSLTPRALATRLCGPILDRSEWRPLDCGHGEASETLVVTTLVATTQDAAWGGRGRDSRDDCPRDDHQRSPSPTSQST
jgi:hypothetical protein